MTERRNLFFTRVQAGSRVYTFALREASNKTRYLLINELQADMQDDAAESLRPIVIFEEHLSAFIDALGRSIRALKLEDRHQRAHQTAKKIRAAALPELEQSFDQLRQLLGRQEKEQPPAPTDPPSDSHAKAYDLDEIRRFYPNAYIPWTEDEDRSLAEAYQQGKKIGQLVDMFRRRPSAIRSRLRKLGLSKD